MKNLKNISAAFLATILLATTASAQIKKTGNESNDFSVKYVGVENDYLCFEVNIAKVNANNAFLKIEDKSEGELYSENLGANGQNLRFRIEKKDGQQLNFQLVSGKNVFTRTFSATTTLTESTVVKENEVAVL